VGGGGEAAGPADAPEPDPGAGGGGGVPDSVSALVDALLEKDPAKRPASADEVERALEDALLEICGGERDRDGDDARSFGGGFSGAELLEIAQFLELHQKSGRLVVSAPPLEGEVLLHQGLIIQASAGQLAGEPAAMALLESPEGTFRFQGSRDEGGYGPPSSALLLKPSVLAIEVLRGRDEKRRAR
jgi:hypothetical protein